jgi:hypothetical protein
VRHDAASLTDEAPMKQTPRKEDGIEMPSIGKALPRPVIKSSKHPADSKLSRHCLQGIAVLMVVMLGACTPQTPPSKLQRNAEAYCREQGFRPGTNDFEGCVEKTEEEILARARGGYQRLMRGEGR